ncbi:response regulator [Dankookia rubra]|uniref:Response regulator n=1 Tax=Dankookia rubra TaxID=1442381 RepID=A0A4V3A9D3_9PROT|nr:response regulator [Dankookia rubra]TDH58815.1 response regulator [Dankookia rubra]
MHIGHSHDHRRMLQGRRVLVVEDDALICMLMEDGLINAGAEVVGPACSVEEALGLLAKEAADSGLNAAVLDIGLDGEMVLPVADRLAYLGVPFIFATGYPEDHNRGLHTTAPTLEKPFDGNTLAGVVGALIGGR